MEAAERPDDMAGARCPRRKLHAGNAGRYFWLGGQKIVRVANGCHFAPSCDPAQAIASCDLHPHGQDRHRQGDQDSYCQGKMLNDYAGKIYSSNDVFILENAIGGIPPESDLPVEERTRRARKKNAEKPQSGQRSLIIAYAINRAKF